MVNRWRREFGQPARLVLFYAEAEANKRKVMYIEPVHILLALIGEEAGLKNIGCCEVNLSLLRESISRLYPPIGMSYVKSLELQTSATDTLRDAIFLKTKLGHRAVGREHLLWSVCAYLPLEVHELLVDQKITRETLEKYVCSVN